VDLAFLRKEETCWPLMVVVAPAKAVRDSHAPSTREREREFDHVEKRRSRVLDSLRGFVRVHMGKSDEPIDGRGCAAEQCTRGTFA
jgi:hypothetical protein